MKQKTTAAPKTPRKIKPNEALEGWREAEIARWAEVVSNCYAIAAGRQPADALSRTDHLNIAVLLESIVLNGEDLPVQLQKTRPRGAPSKLTRNYWIAVDFELRKARGEKKAASRVDEDWNLGGEDTTRKAIAPHRKEARAIINDFRSHKRGTDYGLRQLAKRVSDKCEENKTKGKNRKK